MKKTFSTNPAPNLGSAWGLTALLLLVSLTPIYALAPSSQEASSHLSPHQEEVAFCNQASLTEILEGTVNGTVFGRITRAHPHKQILRSLMHCLMLAHRPHGTDEDKDHNCLNITFDNQGVIMSRFSQNYNSDNFDRKNPEIKQNLTLTLCPEYFSFKLSKTEGLLAKFKYDGKMEKKSDFKILIIIALALYSLLLSYTTICTILFSVSVRIKKCWERRQNYNTADKTSDDGHVYEPMADLMHPPGVLVLPEYDQLPAHSGWPIIRYDPHPAKSLPVYPLKWEDMDQLGSSTKMTRSVEIFSRGSTRMSRRSSLLTMALLSILSITGSMAEQGSALSTLQTYDGDGFQGEETLIVEEGTDVSLLCKSFKYGGDISWEASDQSILSKSAQTGGYLIIPGIKNNITVSCLVNKGFSVFRDVFTILVADPSKEERLEIPRTVEAYDCESPLTHPLARISTHTEECKISDFSSYEKRPQDSFVLLGRDRVRKVMASRCHLKIEVSNAKCDGYRLNGFMKTYEGLYDTSLKQCEELVRTGSTNLTVHHAGFYRKGGTEIIPCIMKGDICYEEHQGKLKLADSDGFRLLFRLWGFAGPSPFPEPTVGPLRMGEFFSKMMFLGGSGANSSDSAKPCWGVDRSFYMGVRASPAGLDHSLGRPKEDLVATMFITAYLDQDTAFVDYEQKIISFPKHGKKLEFKEENDTVHFTDTEAGLIFLQVPEEVSKGFYVIESNVSGVLFTDKTNVEHPDILTLNFHQKSLALQMYKPFLFQNKTDCFTTQLEEIFACKNFPTHNMVIRPEVLSEISSQRFLFQQLNTAQSVKGVLYHLCSNRKMLLDLGINQISKTGGLLFGLRRGIFTLELGEQIILFQCDRTMASVQRLPRDHCTNELPVIVHSKEGPIQRFLSPNTRVLTDQATPAFCSDKFPIKGGEAIGI